MCKSSQGSKIPPTSTDNTTIGEKKITDGITTNSATPPPPPIKTK